MSRKKLEDAEESVESEIEEASIEETVEVEPDQIVYEDGKPIKK